MSIALNILNFAARVSASYIWGTICFTWFGNTALGGLNAFAGAIVISWAMNRLSVRDAKN